MLPQQNALELTRGTQEGKEAHAGLGPTAHFRQGEGVLVPLSQSPTSARNLLYGVLS